MSEEHPVVSRVLRLLAEHLERWLEGDEMAFESLSQSLDELELSGDDLQAAALILRSLAGDGGAAEGAMALAPARGGERVLSADERDALSPEAWGVLLDLKRRGSLSAPQFERVLEMLGSCGVRPVGRDLALDVAGRVALAREGEAESTEGMHGEIDLAH